MGLLRFAAIGWLWAGSMAVQAAPEVEHFSPQGEVKGVRQATARFAQPVVAFGDPRLESPFEVDCAVAGKGRWADGRNWVYDFDSPLPAGLACHFLLKKNFATADGGRLQGGESFSFHTGGPAVLDSEPRRGARIDENQVFILGLDAPVDLNSVRQHAFCEAEWLAERIPVSLVEGKERKAILAQRENFLTRYFRVMTAGGRTLAAFGVTEAGSRREDFLKQVDGEQSALVVLRCQRTLPNNGKFNLVWGSGIKTLSKGGAAPLATTQAQSLPFQVRPPFEASFTCSRTSRNSACVPILPMALRFTSPIKTSLAKQIHLKDEAGHPIYALVDKADAKEAFVTQVAFPKVLPEKTRFKLHLPAALVDDAGRSLINADRFPLALETDEFPPLAKFPARFGIVEKPADGTPALLPVTLRNVEAALATHTLQVTGRAATSRDDLQVLHWLRALNTINQGGEPGKRSLFGFWEEGKGAPAQESLLSKAKRRLKALLPGKAEDQAKEVPPAGADFTGRTFTLPKPGGDKEFEVVGIPLTSPGFHAVELASPRLSQALHAQASTYYVPAAALVTNLAVHFKQGRESSLVWVTRLDTGASVAGAQVQVRDCVGNSHAQGKTDAQGRLLIRKPLPDINSLPGCLNAWDKQFFVTAHLGADFSFLLSSWGEGIQAWRFNLPQGYRDASWRVHALLDRSLLRRGETVSMKVLVRRATGSGFSLAQPAVQPTLKLVHQGSEDNVDLPITWQQDGSGTASWVIPQDSKLGTWEIQANLPGQHGRVQLQAGQFRVEEFRLATMKALMQLSGGPLVNADKATLDIQVNYLNGGGASNLPVRLRSQILPKQVSYPDYEDFSIANGNVKTGKASLSGGWGYDEDGEGGGEMEEDGSPDKATKAKVQDLRLGGSGAGQVLLDGLKPPKAGDRPRDLLAELEYRDANGAIQTSATHLTLWPARLQVGLKTDGWMGSKEPVRVQALVLDLAGKPVAEQHVQVDVFRSEYRSHRRRLLGGFYAYEHGQETRRVGDFCQGKTDRRGLLICEHTLPGSGELILRARVKDGDGNTAYANAGLSVYDEDDYWRSGSDQDRMDLIPEKKSYQPGEKARFEVRMPFKQANVLVTVEREGVLSSFVVAVSRKRPYIEVPVQGTWAPNVFVSALAVRGRASSPAPTALVDLGKPAFRLGIAEIRVGTARHELKVKVSTDKEDYRTRDKAKVHIQVLKPDGSAPPKGAEIALAAVDEGLLELSPNKSWQLLEAMMSRRGIEVSTATAQTQVIGKRHFGKKAWPAGGGGGKGGTREIFDTLLLWKPRVALDEQGRAEVEVPLNDSLTSFRIVALATAGVDRFGTGSTSIRSTQELLLIGGLPPLVREQDRFRAGVTVRNTTDLPMEVRLTAQVTPMSQGRPGKAQPLDNQTLKLAANEAREIGWDMEAAVGVQELQWHIAVDRLGNANGDGATPAADRLKLSQKVIPAVPVRVLQATLVQADKPLSVPVALPSDAIPGRGGVRGVVRARLADDLAGVRDYMSAYPYSCLEQQTSRAVALNDAALWRDVTANMRAYLDADGLAKYFPLMREGSEVLTAYLLAVSHEAGLQIPDWALERMEHGLEGFITGKVRRNSDFLAPDLGIRKLAAIAALIRYRNLEPRWLDSFAIEPNLWPTSALIDWITILKASPNLPGQAEKLANALHMLRSRVNFQGTTMNFSTERNDTFWWLMTGGDVNANRALLAVLDLPGWREDVPRLVTGSLGRQRHGHWNTTVANAWGAVALRRFSERFESVPVTGQSTLRLGRAEMRQDWNSRPQGDSQVLPWPGSNSGTLQFSHQGSGKPWLTLQSLAAVPLKEALFTGYRIQRSLTPVTRRDPNTWSVGDVIRVRLDLEAMGDSGWVAVTDPIPAGATVLGSGLGGDSAILVRDEKKGNWWNRPVFEERSFANYRAYYSYMPQGKWSVEYTLRLNNVGSFQLPPTRVEAMYTPEMFGELPNGRFVVGQ